MIMLMRLEMSVQVWQTLCSFGMFPPEVMEQKVDKRATVIAGSSTGCAPGRVSRGTHLLIHCNELKPGSRVPKRGIRFYFCRIWGQELGRVAWLL